MKVLFATLIALASLSSVAAQSFVPIAPKRGNFSLAFSIQWFGQAGFAPITSIQFNPGYFLADAIELRTPVAYIRGTAGNETVYGLGVRWHPLKTFASKSNPLVDPFVGVIYQHAHAGTSFNEDFSAVLAGLNYFVARNVAITGAYQIGSDRPSGSHQTTLDASIGFTIFFSGK